MEKLFFIAAGLLGVIIMYNIFFNKTPNTPAKNGKTVVVKDVQPKPKTTPKKTNAKKASAKKPNTPKK